MKGSIYIGKFLGIKISVHFTFLLLGGGFLFMFYKKEANLDNMLYACEFIVSVFIFALAHEFGHVVAANQYGIQTEKITLLPIGGFSKLERNPQHKSEELVIAFSGILLNIILAGIMYGINTSMFPLKYMAHFKAYFIGYLPDEDFTIAMMWANIFLAFINFIPVLPMDGSRILRIILSYRFKPLLANTITIRISQVICIAFIVYSFLTNRANFIWAGSFGLYFLGYAELELRKLSRKDLYKHLLVKDAMQTEYASLTSTDTVAYTLKVFKETGKEEFMVIDEGMVVGLVTKEFIERDLLSKDAELTSMIGAVMETDIPRVRSVSPLVAALKVIREYNLPIIPVIDGPRCVGILREEDIRTVMAAVNKG